MQLSSDLGSEEDNEETKINMKLQEIMDAKIYDKNVKDTEYRYWESNSQSMLYKIAEKSWQGAFSDLLSKA